jgi:hypothetical protein
MHPHDGIFAHPQLQQRHQAFAVSHLVAIAYPHIGLEGLGQVGKHRCRSSMETSRGIDGDIHKLVESV